MNENFEIVYLENPEWGVIGGGITNYNKQHAGDDKGKNLCFVIRGPAQDIIGGVIGSTYWNWLSVDLMWIEESYRGLGYGKRLLAKAEEEARKRGAKYAYLDTFSFQAPGFYENYGYEVFGELQNFPPGHQRYFMKKQL